MLIRTHRRLCLAVAVAATLGVVAPSRIVAQDTIRLGDGTQQIFFNNTLIRTYNFGITSSGAGLTLNSIDVFLKGGNAANNVHPTIIQIFDGLGGSGTLITSGTLSASALTSQFEFRTVPLGQSVTLAAGGYSLRMTTANVGDYYIKNSKLTLTSTSGAVLNNLLWIEDSNNTGEAGTTLTASGTVLAQPGLSGSSVHFGNYRVTTGTLTQSLSLANTALATSNNVTQALRAAATTVPAAVNVSGLPNPALAASGATSVMVGLNMATAGVTNSNLVLNYESVPGASATTGTTAIGTGTVIVTGTGWRAATLNVTGTTVNLGRFHVGASGLSGAATVANDSVADGFSEKLSVEASGSSGGASVASLPASIAAGGNGAIGVGLASVTSVGANRGTVTLGFASSGQGTSGLTDLVLGSRVIDVVADGYSGQAMWSVDADGQWNTFASWDEPGGKPGVDGSLSVNDTATFGNAASADRTVRLDGASPVLAALTFSNSTARYTIAPGAGGTLTLGTEQNSATVANHGGNHAITAGVSLARATSIDTAAGSVLTFSGGLSGTSQLSKTGAGELVISGTGSLSGATTVSAGVLRVNGSIADSEVTVQSGATLMGSGVIGDTIVYGIHSPGNSPDVQTTSGNLTYEAGSSVLWELVANTVSGRGTNFDGIDLTGGLTFSGTTSLDLSFTYAGSTVDWGDTFWATSRTGTDGWLVYGGATSLAGFSNLVVAGDDWSDAQGNMLRSVRPGAAFSTYQDGNNVYLVYAVPEPSAWILVTLAAACGWPLARRRTAVRP